ncbi:MAG: cadmium-translocating P-type ATPase [Clostridia bacterium]|nr:cadmium-translocating P-type ATPase [Clostridia bacterium]
MKKLLLGEPFRIAAGLVLFIPGAVLHFLNIDIPALILLSLALLISGSGVFLDALRGIRRLDFLDEKFLMCIASIGAFVIGEYVEGVAVMLFFLVGEYFEHRAVGRSRNAIKTLLDICPDTATVLSDGEECVIDAEDVEVGTVILVRAGERVPLDSVVESGTAELDTSALTGEHLPRRIEPGSLIESGCVVIGGAVVCRTVHTLEQSSATRILELVESAEERKSREESFITKFSRYYTPAVIVLAILMAAVPPIFNLLPLRDSVYRALSFLVVSCPCALVISVPMAFFGGIGGAASRGILYKGGNTFSAISRIENAVFDKTGTLTRGELSVSALHPCGVDEEELLYLAASAEFGSTHPIAEAIKRAARSRSRSQDIEEIGGAGVVATVGDARVAVGTEKLLLSLDVALPDDVPAGAVYVARDGVYIGAITLFDTVKDEAREALQELRALGVKRTYILSGDNEAAVRSVSEELGIDEYRAELTPEGKFELLEHIIDSSSGATLFVGDGINDAPSLARADVGIAMGGVGSDSAIEAADAVIVSDNLSRLPDTVRGARRTLTIAKENIVFAISVKLLVLLLVSFDIGGMWLAVFADVGVAVIAILNAMRAMKLPSRKNK